MKTACCVSIPQPKWAAYGQEGAVAHLEGQRDSCKEMLVDSGSGFVAWWWWRGRSGFTDLQFRRFGGVPSLRQRIRKYLFESIKYKKEQDQMTTWLEVLPGRRKEPWRSKFMSQIVTPSPDFVQAPHVWVLIAPWGSLEGGLGVL